jgi:hypothetical protein
MSDRDRDQQVLGHLRAIRDALGPTRYGNDHPAHDMLRKLVGDTYKIENAIKSWPWYEPLG